VARKIKEGLERRIAALEGKIAAMDKPKEQIFADMFGDAMRKAGKR
jgi:hypothetical protein